MIAKIRFWCGTRCYLLVKILTSSNKTLRLSGDTKEMRKVALTSIASCFFLYFVASVFGYMTFYNYVQSDLLLTYNHSDPRNALTLIVRVCVLIGVMLTLPLTHYPVSQSFYSKQTFLGKYWTVFQARKAVNFLLFPQADFAWKRHIGIMCCLLTLCVTLVIAVPDIKEIFGFVGKFALSWIVMMNCRLQFVVHSSISTLFLGASASGALMMILPPLFYLKINNEPLKGNKQKQIALGFLIFGVAFSTMTLGIMVYAKLSGWATHSFCHKMLQSNTLWINLPKYFCIKPLRR